MTPSRRLNNGVVKSEEIPLDTTTTTIIRNKGAKLIYKKSKWTIFNAVCTLNPLEGPYLSLSDFFKAIKSVQLPNVIKKVSRFTLKEFILIMELGTFIKICLIGINQC
jgi:hypothetical protein